MAYARRKGAETRAPRNCQQCGASFVARVFDIERGRAKYCSQACFRVTLKFRGTGKTAARKICSKCGGRKGWHGKLCRKCCDYGMNTIRRYVPFRQCEWCEHGFRPAYRNSPARFCSNKCSRQWQLADPQRINKPMPGFYYRKKRVDLNQHEIAMALLRYGANVLSLAQIGGGVPDLVVAYAGETVLMEVKNPKTRHGKAGLSPGQKKFADSWPGRVFVVRTIDEALAAMAEIRGKATRHVNLDLRVQHYRLSAELPQGYNGMP